ncbi:MAG: 23S rRNA (adenine(2503)-C(2))-methyltransferase RlmN [Fimbriimonadaceae bacterium]
MSQVQSEPNSSNKPALLGLGFAELAERLAPLDIPSYRVRQIGTWLHQKGATTFGEMSDLPAALRLKLNGGYSIDPLLVAKHLKSTDTVQKLLLHNGDQQVFECVLLPYRSRVSCCLSSQVGCPMACTFCATGLGGFDRNLTQQEITSQLLMLQRLSEKRISHLVMMGMGEPLLNWQNVRGALEFFSTDLDMSYRRMTISTVGIVPGIREVTEWGKPVHLALSLHSPFDEVRSQLMPVNAKWPVAEAIQAMKDHAASTHRKITIEYLLIAGINDQPETAREIARLLGKTPHVINVIPFNWVATQEGFKRPTREGVRQFLSALEREGLNATERTERGHDIAAACGQLAGAHTGKFGGRSQKSALPVLS